MVDLVKIRRKAKEKLAREKAAGEGESAAGEASQAELSEKTAQAEVSVPHIEVSVPHTEMSVLQAIAKLEAFKERVGRAGDADSDADASSEQKEVELELLTFLVADEIYAIDIEKIVEIVPPRTATRVPNAQPGVLGIISLRGTIVTVIDLGSRLSHGNLPVTPTSRMIVVARHGETAAFLVDRVLRVVSFSPHALEFTPSVGEGEYHDYIMGVFRQESALTILLDIDKVLSA